MRGGVAKRETLHFGYDYDYDGWTISKTDPHPEELTFLIERAAREAGIQASAIEQVMVARYPAGATINWHRDAPMFGSPVIGISLGAACEMRFRHALEKKPNARRRTFETYAVRLEPRSIYILDGDARTKWQHSIPPTPGLRYSITMRTLRRARNGRTRLREDGGEHGSTL